MINNKTYLDFFMWGEKYKKFNISAQSNVSQMVKDKLLHGTL